MTRCADGSRNFKDSSSENERQIGEDHLSDLPFHCLCDAISAQIPLYRSVIKERVTAALDKGCIALAYQRYAAKLLV